MYISDATLDDLLRRVISRLLKSKTITQSSRGPAQEVSGVLLRLTNPRARLSRTERRGRVFSCLGELFWYLSKSKDVDFISYYISQYKDETEDGTTVHGAYGPRLFALQRDGKQIDQIRNLISLLKRKPQTRRAVLQIFDASDLEGERKEVPCTCTLQFIVRGRRVHMFANMRSNDAFFGLPHDVFAFTMIQEIVARELNLEVGWYKHYAVSLHLYEKDRKGAETFLAEGFQSNTSMPPMPPGDPWSAIKAVVRAESSIRFGESIDVDRLRLPEYWSDLIRLFQIYRAWRDADKPEITRLKRLISTRLYDPYIDQKQKTATKRRPHLGAMQLDLFGDRPQTVAIQ